MKQLQKSCKNKIKDDQKTKGWGRIGFTSMASFDILDTLGFFFPLPSSGNHS